MERIKQIPGEVFHVISDNNKLIRFRIDETGKILYDKTFARVSSRIAESEIGTKLSEARGKARQRWRGVVTGNPDKKIRDYMKEVPQVKFIDKLSFTFGVTCIAVTEFLALRHPTYFVQFYYLLMAILLANRYIEYSASKDVLFMIDFCYFVNLSVVLQTGLYPESLLWYKANYVMCMGCLMLAIVVWQNSLVFHSLDKLTSFFLHAFPPLTMHLFRWGLIPCGSIKPDDELSLSELILLPLGLYAVWQVGYLFITEYLIADVLAADKELTTSLRHLAKDKKNGMNLLVTSLLRKSGILTKGEEFDPETWKTKIVFIVAQMVFTLLTLIPCHFLYTNYSLSFAYICAIYGWCIWRGGSYYIEVFSERYKLKFISHHDMHDEGNHSEDEHGEEDHHDDFYDAIVEALKDHTDEDAEIPCSKVNE